MTWTAKRRQRPTRLLGLLVVASVVSARTVSLSSFELIAAFVPTGCLDAYNTTIEDCDINDFLIGAQCSTRCIRNLRQIESTIQGACTQARPRPGTLLDRTRDGELVAALCGQGQDDSSPPTPVEPTSTLADSGPDLPIQTRTVTKAITPMPLPTSDTSTSSSSSSSSTYTQRYDTEIEETTMSESLPTSTTVRQPPRSSKVSSSETESTSVPAETDPPQTSSLTTFTRPPQSTATAGAEPGSEDDENDGDDSGIPPGSGGGGLSDIGFEGRASASLKPNIVNMAAIAAVAIGWQVMQVV